MQPRRMALKRLFSLASPTSAVASPFANHPTVALTARSLCGWLARHHEGLWIALILLVATLTHAINMFHFPYYETDEGTYMAQAWAVVTQGRLAPYTYIYDHAPLGWIQIAAWAVLTGGFDTFGMAVESGRVLMLVFQIGSTLMLYRIARSLTGSITTASIVSLLFALSAYGLLYHRRVLLDNVATFWMLLGIMLLVAGRSSLTRVWLSACALGVSVLSKEVTIVVVPVLACLIFFHTHRAQRWFAAIGWTAIVTLLVSAYPLLAILKSELLPTGWLPGDSTEHVSLIGTLQWQASRAKDGGMIDAGSKFWLLTKIWVRDEPLLVLGGTLSALVSLLAIRRRPVVGLMGAATLALWVFLGRGGEILPFYLLPALPLLALNLGLILDLVTRRAQAALERSGRGLGRMVGRSVRPVTAGLCLSCLLAGYTSPNLGIETRSAASTGYVLGSLPWKSEQSVAQKQALDWIRANIAPGSSMIIDNYMWTDLRKGGDFGRAHWYWKVELDPEIKQGVFLGDWRYVDYIVTTGQLLTDTQVENLELVAQALAHSTPLVRFNTGGWPIEIRRVNKLQQWTALDDPMLTRTWAGYKGRFLDGGRVITSQDARETTSEGQSHALLRAVYMDDRPTFDQVWAWTKAQLQVRGDGLLAWRWGVQLDGSWGVLDRNTSTDADQDTALALLFASQRWGEVQYRQEALAILPGIWERETVDVAGRRIVVAGDWARGDWSAELNSPVVNPSHFAPYAYRIFAQADPDRAWGDLVDSSYDVLARVAATPELGGAAGLVPNWLTLDPQTGAPQPATALGPDASRFAYDASRLPWRLTLDWLWFQDDRAVRAVTRVGVPRRELEETGKLMAVYHADGLPAVDHEALPVYAGTLGGLLFGQDRDLAHRVFAEKILSEYGDGPQGAYWGDPDNYYDQNWAWFATALMDGAMSNLWSGETVIRWDKVLP